MPTRACAACGEKKEIEGGMICERGHFICRACSGKSKGIIFDHTLSRCPVCKSKLT